MRESSKLSTCLTVGAVLTTLTIFSSGLGITNSRPLLKFCFNSRDQFVAAQCVLCDFYKFSATILGCNGRTSALMSNITSTEAVCIISNCLQQVRQPQPQFTGRKKREVEELPHTVEGDNVFSEEPGTATAAPSMDNVTNYDVMNEEEMLKELEARVVDTFEVNIEEEDYFDVQFD